MASEGGRWQALAPDGLGHNEEGNGNNSAPGNVEKSHAPHHA